MQKSLMSHCVCLCIVGAMALFRSRVQFPPAAEDVLIYLDDVCCIGDELRLEDCPSDTITEDCLHFLQDVGVQCQPANA